MLNVLHLDHTRDPGGAELALARLCEQAISRKLWIPMIAAPAATGSLDAFAAESLSAHLLEVGPPQQGGIIKGGVSSKVRAAFQMSAFIRNCLAGSRGRRIDVIHANTTRSALIGARLQRWIPAPLVIHLRDYWTNESLGAPILSLLRHYAAPHATLAIANSNGTASTAIERGGLESRQIIVIPSPVGVPLASTPMVHDGLGEQAVNGRRRVEILMVHGCRSGKGSGCSSRLSLECNATCLTRRFAYASWEAGCSGRRGTTRSSDNWRGTCFQTAT